MQIWQDIWDMLKAPFTERLDITHLVLMLAVLIVLGGLVALALEHIRIAAAVEV